LFFNESGKVLAQVDFTLWAGKGLSHFRRLLNSPSQIAPPTAGPWDSLAAQAPLATCLTARLMRDDRQEIDIRSKTAGFIL